MAVPIIEGAGAYREVSETGRILFGVQSRSIAFAQRKDPV
jgi:hypothetical protein